MPSVSRKVPAQAGVRSRTYVTNLKWLPPNVDFHDLIERDACDRSSARIGWDCDRNGAHSEGPFDLGNEDRQTILVCACCERLPNLLAVRREDGKAHNRAFGRAQLSGRKREPDTCIVRSGWHGSPRDRSG